MKSYFPKAPVNVVAGGLATNCTDEQYAELLEQMAPIAEQVAEKLNQLYINKVVMNLFEYE
jgi:hypothetical protein